MEEKKEQSGALLFDQIVKATFTRHAGKTTEELFKDFGLKGENESQEVRKAKLMLMTACTGELFNIKEKIDLIKKTIMLGCDIKESDLQEKGEN